MPSSLLLSQCLQNDFVQPIGRFDPLPNRLHVGYHEALRLLGEVPDEGPVARTMRWAKGMPADRLHIIHIRDWHDPTDAAQHGHLGRFGKHCVRGTEGAAFAFDVGEPGRSTIVDSLTLNDFEGTKLAEVLRPFAGRPLRVGIVGVWTEAKVSFLAYELCTRYPTFEVSVCSALTASSSRAHHFASLDQLERILGVRVFDSAGEFIGFLGGAEQDAPLIGIADKHPAVDGGGMELTATDRTLIRYLFRDCKEVRLTSLSGGYSGNVVAAAESVDLHGHDQVPHVVKVGSRALMGQERTSFERIQEVLGNSAPHISEYADYEGRGAIKYRYASMTGRFATTFQKRYAANIGHDEVRRILDTVFGEQLMRLYKAATLERCDLFEHYGFSSRWAGSVREKTEAILGAPAPGPTIEILPGVHVANVCDFYEQTLAQAAPRPGGHCFQAYVHGDLNGANIVLDGHGNVWLIDFFHTRRAHVLMDLIKLENDLLYIFTSIQDDTELREALRITDALVDTEDLAAPLPEAPPSALPQLARAWDTLRVLRSYYPRLIHAHRDPLQYWIAALRYAVHTGSFFESSALQKRWALYAAGRCAEKVERSLEGSSRLRVDWLDTRFTVPGRIGLTILPGRKDYARDLDRDLLSLREDGVQSVLCLVPQEELARYGVGALLDAYAGMGFDTFHVPVLDQKACSVEDMMAAVRWLDAAVQQGRTVMVHCVGGLGRTGMAAACYLRSRGVTFEEALREVRRVRTNRAVETEVQEALVRTFPA